MDMVFSGRAAMGGGIASPSSVVAAAGNDALYAFCMQHIQLASHTTLSTLVSRIKIIQNLESAVMPLDN